MGLGRKEVGGESCLSEEPALWRPDPSPPRHPREAPASVSPNLAQSMFPEPVHQTPRLQTRPPASWGSWPLPSCPSSRRAGPYLQAMTCFLASGWPVLPSPPLLRKLGDRLPQAVPRGSLQGGNGKGKYESPGTNILHTLVSAGREGMEWQ